MLKDILIFTSKLALALLLLYWLYQSDALSLVTFEHFEPTPYTTVLLCLNVSLLIIGAFLLSLRMWLVLRISHFNIDFSEAVRVNLSSMCLGLALPGVIGVDAIRASYFCLKNKKRKVDAFTSIFLDRIIGIYALILLASSAAVLGLLLDLELIHISFVIVSVSTLITTTIGLSIICSRKIQNITHLTTVFKCLPLFIQQSITAIQRVSSFPKEIFICLFISIISQIITISNFVIFGILINDSLPVLAHFIINPIALFLTAIPLTPGGLGITESAFSYLFQTAGSNNGAVISLLARVNQYFVYIIIGLPALFLMKLKASPTEQAIKLLSKPL